MGSTYEFQEDPIYPQAELGQPEAAGQANSNLHNFLQPLPPFQYRRRNQYSNSSSNLGQFQAQEQYPQQFWGNPDPDPSYHQNQNQTPKSNHELILYGLLTGDSNNNDSYSRNYGLHSKRSGQEDKEKAGVSWKSKPSWGIYFKDQGDNLVKFNFPGNDIIPDEGLNRTVSLSLDDTCISVFEVDAIVNSTTPEFSADFGVSKAIWQRAGPDLKKECDTLRNQIHLGQAVTSRGYNLPAKYIIHVYGPRKTDAEWPELLKNCYQQSLQILVSRGLRTIVFPCISTGSKNPYAVDSNEAARIALNTVRTFLLANRHSVDRVIFSVHNTSQVIIYRRFMQVYFPVDAG